MSLLPQFSFMAQGLFDLVDVMLLASCRMIFSLHLSYTALEIEFTRSQIVAAIPGTFFCAWYASQKHWLANNILGLAFCIQVWHHSFKIILVFLLLVFLDGYLCV